MAKRQLRGVGSGYEMAGLKRGGRKAKRKSASKSAPKGWKPVGKPTCLRKRKGRMVLKPGCKWGRGRYKGKLLKKTK